MNKWAIEAEIDEEVFESGKNEFDFGFKTPHYFIPNLNNHIIHVGYKNIELRGRNFDLVTFGGIVQTCNEPVK